MQDRIKRWTEALMMIPGLSGFEGNVRRYIKAELKALGLESKTDMLGNLITTIEKTVLYNPSSLKLWFRMDGALNCIEPGQLVQLGT